MKTNHVFWLTMIVVSLTLLLVVACNRPIDPIDSSTTSKPGTSTVTQPGTTTSTSPGSATGTGGTLGVYRVFRIMYATNDFQEVQYDLADQPVYLRSRTTSMLGGNSSMTQRHYQFTYRSNGQLQRVAPAGGNYFVYQYGPTNRISRVDEHTAGGRLLVTRTYLYNTTGN